MRVRFGDSWVADSEDVVLLHEPGRYPVAYFSRADISSGVLEASEHTSLHRDLGPTRWWAVRVGDRAAARGAWEHTDLPAYAHDLENRLAFGWRTMDAFFEEDERIVGHAADMYHRIDIRQASRRLAVRNGDQVIADATRPIALYESGFAPRWYVPREDIDESTLTPNETQTFCPYKGVCSYYDIGDAHRAAWSHRDAYTEVARVSDLVSFEPDKVTVELDDRQLHLEPGQTVIPHGVDRELSLHELTSEGQPQAAGLP